jgi:UDP-N-acetyl-D-glucosamine dehydrogenase
LLVESEVGHITYADPFVSKLEVETKRGPISLSSADLSPELVRESDVVVIVTNHSTFPYEMIAAEARMIIDTRNALKDIKGSRGHILLLGGGTF